MIVDIFNVVLFLYDKKYLKIKDMFSTESSEVRSKRSFFCILYSLITMFGSIIIIAIFGLPN
jgi:hypothetical protein